MCTGVKSYGPTNPLELALDAGKDGDAAGSDGIGGGGEGDLLATAVELLRLLDLLLIGLRKGRNGGGGCEERCISSMRNHSDEFCVIQSGLRARLEQRTRSESCPTFALSDALDLLLASFSMVLLDCRFMEEGSKS